MKTFVPLVALASLVSIATAAPIKDAALVKRGVAAKEASSHLFVVAKRDETAENVDDDNNKSGASLSALYISLASRFADR